MSNRVQWDAGLEVGHQAIDDQHRNLLAQCDALADCLADASPEGQRKFHETFDELMSLAREHFAAEEALLAHSGATMLEDLRSERDEFEYLAEEIITTENFDRSELQRFLVLWWTGHIVGSVRKRHAFSEHRAG